jgi:hypothetical protein
LENSATKPTPKKKVAIKKNKDSEILTQTPTIKSKLLPLADAIE